MQYYSVFIKSRKPANFAVYCGIYSSYFISDKNRSVLFRNQLYVFWDCLYSGSVFDSVCFSSFFRYEMGNQSLLDLNHFRKFNPGEFSVLNMYNYLTLQNNVRRKVEILNMFNYLTLQNNVRRMVEISLICLKGRYWTSSSQAERLSSLEVCIS